MSAADRSRTGTSRWIFTPRGVAAVSAAFIAAVLVLNLGARLVYAHIVKFDLTTFWPLGMSLPRRPALYQVAMAVVVVVLFYAGVRLLRRAAYRLGPVIGAAVVLVVATNLLQGWSIGFRTPMAGGGSAGIQYYHDALAIESAGEFVRRFGERQEHLLVHSRTHPPGAVLSIYLLHRMLGDPAAIALAVAGVSTVLSLLFLHGILVKEPGETALARYVVLLFALIPAVQIYYAASLDALVAAFLLGAAYFLVDRRTAVGISGSFVCIALASFMSFGFLFILPVILLTELLRYRRIVRTAITIALLIALYVVVERVTGFNYLTSFATAASLENPSGFMLFACPASYLFTRLESVLEIIVFFGPFLALAAVRGFRPIRPAASILSTMTIVAVATLAAMLLTGAFRTAETARCCLFIYPFLMFPVARYLEREPLAPREETVLLCVVFAQTVCMQLFGYYFW